MKATTKTTPVRVSTSVHLDEGAVERVAVGDAQDGYVSLWIGPMLVIGSLKVLGDVIDEAALKLSALSLEHAAREDAA